MALIAGLVVAVIATPLAARLATRVGLVAHPGPLRVNTGPVPYLGGLAVFVGLVREMHVRVSAGVGSTEDLPGSSSTSSNVSPSGMGPSIIASPACSVRVHKTSINAKTQRDPPGMGKSFSCRERTS